MEEDANQKLRKRTKLFQRIVIHANTLLSRWSSSTNSSENMLAQVETTVGEVIRETESAAMQVGESFQSIMKMTRRQTELATGLLKKQDGSSADKTSILGLQDYVKLYDDRLAVVNQQLSHVSTLAEEMAKHQKLVRTDTDQLEQVLDEMHAMSTRISSISLNASVAATKQEFDFKSFIEMIDQVRSISGQSHELTRRARTSVDSIRTVINRAAKQTVDAELFTREASARSSKETKKLNTGILEKGRDVEKALLNINDLGRKINTEIQAIIVAMQFQDITQQKLERVRGSDIGSVRQSLAGLSHETMALMQRDVYRAILSYSQSSIKPMESEKSSDDVHDAKAEIDSGKSIDLLVEPTPEKPRANVELF